MLGGDTKTVLPVGKTTDGVGQVQPTGGREDIYHDVGRTLLVQGVGMPIKPVGIMVFDRGMG